MASKLSLFLAELKRRKVYRVAVVYVVVGAGVIGLCEAALPPDIWQGLQIPVGVIVLVGLPIALVLAWAYEVKPEAPRDQLPQAEEEVTSGVALGGKEAPTAAFEIPELTDRRAVAVLPLANLSGDPENEYFADGMTEDILARLTRVRGLKVISRTSVMQYKNTAKNVREIASELGVEAVVEGSVRRSEGRVRIAAQLIDARSDDHLWADTFDREMQDVFAVQSEVAEQIAFALETELSDGERVRVRHVPTDNLEAYELCLRGRHELFQMTREHLQRASELLLRAVELDPSYALGHAHLAMTLGSAAYWGGRPPSSAWPQARDAAERALAIDQELAESHAALASVKLHFEWDWPGVEEELDRAISLTPSSADAHLIRSIYCTCRERHDEAVHAIQEAQSLDPLSSYLQAVAGNALAYAGKYDEAIALLRTVTTRDPGFMLSQFHLGLAYHWLGRPDEAVGFYERASQLSGQDPIHEVCAALALAETGDVDSARKKAESVLERARQEYVYPEVLAWAAMVFDDEDTALDYLEEAVQERSPYVLWYRAAPFARRLWGENPRFLALMKQIWPDDEFSWETS